MTDDGLWLGYSGLIAPYSAVSAIMVYQSFWDRRIRQSYGTVPAGIRCVVLLEDGRVLPAQRPIEDLRRQLSTWQNEQPSSDPS